MMLRSWILKAIICAGALLWVVASDGADLQHFNPDVLGASSMETVKLLLHSTSNAISPSSISLELKNGKYIGATLVYPKTLSFAEARRSLNQLYEKFEKPSFKNNNGLGLWRCESKGFAIQLAEEDEELRIIYIVFRPTSEVLKRVEGAERLSKPN